MRFERNMNDSNSTLLPFVELKLAYFGFAGRQGILGAGCRLGSLKNLHYSFDTTTIGSKCYEFASSSVFVRPFFRTSFS